jgi:hypothetical protein
MYKQRKEDIKIQEILKFSLNKYKDLYNKIKNNTYSIEEIELYFTKYNDEIENNKVMKLDVFQDYNVMIQIFEKINLIINKDIIENDLDKILEFFSIFKIKENNLMLKIEEIKTIVSNKISKENIDNIIGDIDSLDILSKKDEFNIFMRELINIKNLLKIFKEFSSEIFKEFFEYSTDSGLDVQNIEKLIILSSLFKEFFEKTFKNENEFFSEIKIKLYNIEENKEKVNHSLILNTLSIINNTLCINILDILDKKSYR